jgi:hypothetical protein
MHENPGSPLEEEKAPDVAGVERVSSKHDALLAKFFRAAWGDDSSPDSIREWREREAKTNPVDPGVEPPKWAFLKENEIIGYLGTIPVHFYLEEGGFPAHWLKGFWVLPGYRGGPVGYMVLHQALEDLGPAAASVVGTPARRLFEALGMTDLGVMYNRLLVLRPARMLKLLDLSKIDLPGGSSLPRRALPILQKTRTTSIVGGLFKLGLALRSGIRGLSARKFSITTDWNAVTSDQLDAVWEKARTSLPAAASRDANTILTHYRNDGDYHLVAAWEGGELSAWAVLKDPGRTADGPLSGLSVASLSDLLFPVHRMDLGVAVIAGAERIARRRGADAVLCSGTHETLRRALSARSFLKIPGNLHFMVRGQGGAQFPEDLGSWWLTRGDAGSDGAF